jgi:tetratricopeptide (TPR) repeat protein
MAIKGSLKEASLADVCQLLALGQKTGSLSVTDRSRFGQIFFRRGRITYASIVNRRDRLGDLLVRDELLTHEDLQHVVQEQAKQPDRRLGELLIDRGLLTEEQLHRYIRQQIEEAIYHLFTWSQGSFYFEVDEAPGEREILVSINPESVLLEGARRVDEWSLIEKKIPSFDLLFVVDRAYIDSAGVELTPVQEQIVPMLDGSATIQELVDRTGLPEFDVGQALFGLIQAGFAVRAGRRDAPQPQRAVDATVAEHTNLGIAFYRAAMLEEAAESFRTVQSLRPTDLTARFHLALLALRRGRPRESLRLFKELVESHGGRYAFFMNIAVALRRLGMLDDALLVLEEAERAAPGGAAQALLRAAINLDGTRLPPAMAALDEYRRRLGGEAPVARYYHIAALVEAVQGRLRQAERLLREGLELHPAAAPLLLLAGVIAERQVDLPTAERYYRGAAEQDPTLVQAYKNLGDLAYRRGLHEEAMEHYQRAAHLAPNLGDDLWAKLGNIHYKRHQREDAVRAWLRALELNPDNRNARNNLSVVGHAVG